MARHAPETEAELADLVRGAAAPFEIEGGGSLRGFGRPVQAADVLALDRLTGITLYRPSELVLQARAGTPVEDAARALAEAGQALPFEPPDLRDLLGTQDTRPTLGGLVATNLSGPARIARGALRDSLIGVRFVDGAGQVVRSGGRVMKNVTGLDLVKLLAGAHGTLGVLGEVTFKVLPEAPAETTLVLDGQEAAAAGRAMQAAMASPFEVTAAAWLPAALTGEAARTLLRLQTFDTFLDRRADALARLLHAHGPARRLDAEPSRALWRDVRDVRVFAEPRDRAVWRLSTAPTDGPGLADSLARALGGDAYLDWAGGLVWLAVPETGDAGAAAIRARLRPLGGHATLVRGSPALRAAVDVFEPQADALQRLTGRLKATFDPEARLNPGRMYPGI
ncbi:MAG: FAD-binding protein [Pseudomonadota bacterium]